MYKCVESKKITNDIDIPDKFSDLFGKQESILVISAWKYPGVTVPNENIPIEIENEIYEGENFK